MANPQPAATDPTTDPKPTAVDPVSVTATTDPKPVVTNASTDQVDQKVDPKPAAADDNDAKIKDQVAPAVLVQDDIKTQAVASSRFPVQVFVRIRPLVGLEITENHQSIKYIIKKTKNKKTKIKKQSLILKNVSGSNINNLRDKKYLGFREIIEPNCNNFETFNKCILPICIPYTFLGEKVCCFAYGHTGSGKTHTIFGYSAENVPGMYELYAKKLFNDARICNNNNISIEIRFVELYQNKLYDLLYSNLNKNQNQNNNKQKQKRECFLREDINGIIQIRAEPEKCLDGKIRAYPISSVHVKTLNKLLEVISDGINSRNVGSSTLHDKSSRSHAFLEFEIVSSELIAKRKELIECEADILIRQILMDTYSMKYYIKKYGSKDLIPAAKLKWIELKDGITYSRDYNVLTSEVSKFELNKKKIIQDINNLCSDINAQYIGGTMVFVDLAGNEYGRDVKTKDIREEKERNEINKSLLSLKECIRGLHNNKDYIGYRNSKLTMYLRKYLNGKDSKAIMISNIGNSQNYVKQSINTLQYSQLVAKA